MKTAIGTYLIITALTLTGLISGCKGYEDEELLLSTAAGTSSTVIPGVVNNSLGFKVEVTSSTNYAYNAHQSGLTTECSTTTGSVAVPTTIDCIIEAKEFDLYYNGISLAYNVPTDMCTYFGVTPYYYYNWEPGVGFAGTVEIEVDANSNVYFITPGSHVGAPTAAGVASGASEGTANPASYAGVSSLLATTPVCTYDHSLSGGSNCCTGTYNLLVHTQAAAGTWTTGSLVSTAWGGSHANCLSGPAMATQAIAANGYPRATVSYVSGTGISSSYAITAPNSSAYSSNVPVANFFTNMFTGAARATATTGGVATDTSPFYSFVCYDRTFDILAQIRVAIREWNVNADYDASAASGLNDLSAFPDTSGAEPSGGNYNDMADMDDFENGDATTVPVIPNQNYPQDLE